MWLHSLKVAQLLLSAACLHTSVPVIFEPPCIMTPHAIKISSSEFSNEYPTKSLSSAAFSKHPALRYWHSFITRLLSLQSVFTKRTSGHRLGKLEADKFQQFGILCRLRCAVFCASCAELGVEIMIRLE